MANEFTLTYQMTYANGNLKQNFQPGSLQFPQAGKGIAQISIPATTAATAVSIGNLTTPGLAVFYNTEATTTGNTWNFAFASSTGGMPIQYSALKPKQLAQVYYGSSTMSLIGQMASGTATIDARIYQA